MTGKKPHDPMLCFCGTNDCSCPCEDCLKRNAELLKIERRLELVKYLEDQGIGVDDLADLVWMAIEPEVENRIEKLVDVLVRERMRRLVLQSKVEWSSL